MSNILTLVDHADGKIRSATLAAVNVARQAAAGTGGKSMLLVVGSDVGTIADEAAQYGDVLVASHADLGDYSADAWAPVIVQAAQESGARLVIGPATAVGKDVLPRCAALLDAGMASDISAFVSLDGDKVTVKRPMWAGNVIGTVQVSGPQALLTVRATEFDAAQPQAAPGTVTALTVAKGGNMTRTTVVGFSGGGGGGRPDATEAKVVVAGGRGTKGAEGFQLLEELTDLLGGGIGASRAATDAGWVPPDWQIGQTGKMVAPDLYFAVGISGAIQHIAGIKASKVIVAINKNSEEPIFEIADYGLVADLFTAVPELIAEIKKLR